jgi:8-oxo-dGTP diphosphatase
MSDSQGETAGALLFDAQGRALLGLRAAHKEIASGCWDIIGGRVELGESPDDALVRELREELAITATKFALIASLPDPEAAGWTHNVFAVSAWTGGPPANACDEHDEIRWFELAEIESLANKTPFDFADLFARAACFRNQIKADADVCGE